MASIYVSTLGNDTTGDGSQGNPYATLSKAHTVASNYDQIYMKNDGTYNVTTNLTITKTVRIAGYNTVIGDGGKATIDGGTSGVSYIVLTLSGTNISLSDLIINRNGASGSANLVSGSGGQLRLLRCVLANALGANLSWVGTGVMLAECELYGAGGIGFSNSGFGVAARRSIFHDNSSHGFSTGSALYQALFEDCIFDSNGGIGAYLNGGTMLLTLLNCDFYNNTSDGVRVNDFAVNGVLNIENCNFIKNGRYGIGNDGGGQTVWGRVLNCGFGSGNQANTSGSIVAALNSTLDQSGAVTYANDITPWIDPANGDFRISLAAASGTGRGSFTQTQGGYAGTVGYPDIGAAQHPDPAAPSALYLISGSTLLSLGASGTIQPSFSEGQHLLCGKVRSLSNLSGNLSWVKAKAGAS